MNHFHVQRVPAERVNDLFVRRCFHGERLTVAFVELDAGCAVPQHRHENEQFSYAVSGTLVFDIEGEEVVLCAGDLVEIPSNVSHRAVATERYVGIDIFSPVRADWRAGTDDHLGRSS